MPAGIVQKCACTLNHHFSINLFFCFGVKKAGLVQKVRRLQKTEILNVFCTQFTRTIAKFPFLTAFLKELRDGNSLISLRRISQIFGPNYDFWTQAPYFMMCTFYIWDWKLCKVAQFIVYLTSIKYFTNNRRWDVFINFEHFCSKNM